MTVPTIPPGEGLYLALRVDDDAGGTPGQVVGEPGLVLVDEGWVTGPDALAALADAAEDGRVPTGRYLALKMPDMPKEPGDAQSTVGMWTLVDLTTRHQWDAAPVDVGEALLDRWTPPPPPVLGRTAAQEVAEADVRVFPLTTWGDFLDTGQVDMTPADRGALGALGPRDHAAAVVKCRRGDAHKHGTPWVLHGMGEDSWARERAASGQLAATGEDAAFTWAVLTC